MIAESTDEQGAGDGHANSDWRRDSLRILMVAPQPFFRVRGTPFSVLHRIRALLKLGHEVELVTYPFGEEPEPELDGLTIRRVGRPPGVTDVPIGPSVPKILLDVPVFLTTLRRVRSGDFDLLHTHEEAGAMGAWIRRRFDVPHLYDMHSSLPQQFDNFGRFNWRPVVSAFESIESYTLADADGVIAICQELKDRVVGKRYTGPVEVIENTLDIPPPEYDEPDEERLRSELGLGPEQRVLLYTGTFESYQGLPLLVQAMSSVIKHQPDARCVLVGGEADQIEELRQVTEAAGVEDNVDLVPKVEPEKIFLFHRIADVLVTTRTRGTNTPLKIYQYLRAGLPIVATNIYSHTQVLSDATAELVEPEPADIGEGIRRVLDDPERARRLAENAGRLARRKYSEEAYMEKLASLLDQVMRTSRSRAVA